MAAPAKNTDGIQQQKAPDATSSGIGKPGEIKTAELPEEQKKPVILLERVNKSFDLGKTVVQILKDINVQIFPREFIVILGPSGSGKSTLLNTLLGLEPPSSGRVVMNNIDITRKKQDKIAKIRYGLFGIVFQRPEWVRSLSVVQNVALPLSINGTEKDKRMRIAWEKLKLIGMDTHGKYFPTELSGGQQQKVTLARALVNDPQVIIADEPTGNLDSASADRVMDLFKNLNERFHKTIIMVTHNIDYVRYASRTIYIRDGKVIEGSEQFLSG
ncbi:MAG: ABC transporter ATP-binding protein [Patescibacteria group bacterium]